MKNHSFFKTNLNFGVFFLFLFVPFLGLHAQKAIVLNFDVINDSTALVKYDFIGSRLDTCSVELQFSPKNKNKFKTVPSSEVSGDVGTGIKVGNGRSLIWHPIKGFDLKQVIVNVKLSNIEKLEFTEMVFIQGGSFMMGSQESEVKRDENEVLHKVSLTSFYMSKNLVTQKQWQEVMGNNPSHFTACEKCPVEMITYDEVKTFIEKINSKTNLHYRMPTEAEWEYAARAGTNTVFYTGNNITTKQCNYNGNYPYNGNPQGKNLTKTCPVGNYPSNPWGLNDMAGNVYQWCSDWFGPYDLTQTNDPKGSATGKLRVIRGGSWFDVAQYLRSANRYYYDPKKNRYSIGIRLVRD